MFSQLEKNFVVSKKTDEDIDDIKMREIIDLKIIELKRRMRIANAIGFCVIINTLIYCYNNVF